VTTYDTKKILSELSKHELKDIVKLAIKEWLDEQAMIFGKMSLKWLFRAGAAALLFFILIAQGWVHK